MPNFGAQLTRTFVKYLYIFLGSISLALGVLGIFLPVLPTTPFLLLTAALYFKSSERLYLWLIRQPKLGPYILNFREHRAITKRTKIVSIAMMWCTISISAFCFVPLIWVRILMFVIAIAVTWHIMSFKTIK